MVLSGLVDFDPAWTGGKFDPAAGKLTCLYVGHINDGHCHTKQVTSSPE